MMPQNLVLGPRNSPCIWSCKWRSVKGSTMNPDLPSGVVCTRSSRVPTAGANSSASSLAPDLGGALFSLPQPGYSLEPHGALPHCDAKYYCSPLPKTWQFPLEWRLCPFHTSLHPWFWCNSKNKSHSGSEYSFSQLLWPLVELHILYNPVKAKKNQKMLQTSKPVRRKRKAFFIQYQCKEDQGSDNTTRQICLPHSWWIYLVWYLWQLVALWCSLHIPLC